MQVGLDVQLLVDMQQAIASLEPRAAPKNSDPQPTQDTLYQVWETALTLLIIVSIGPHFPTLPSSLPMLQVQAGNRLCSGLSHFSRHASCASSS